MHTKITVNFIVDGVCNPVTVYVLFDCVFIICSFVKYFVFCADKMGTCTVVTSVSSVVTVCF